MHNYAGTMLAGSSERDDRLQSVGTNQHTCTTFQSAYSGCHLTANATFACFITIQTDIIRSAAIRPIHAGSAASIISASRIHLKLSAHVDESAVRFRNLSV
jgi:hypothetical protein